MGAFMARVVWTFLVLAILPFPVNLVPGVGQGINDWVSAGLTTLARQLGTIALGMKDIPAPGVTGSGDTTESYLINLLVLSLAIVIAAGLTIRRRSLPIGARAEAWLRAWLRVSLACVMISYGAIKILSAQMPPPDATRLVEFVGEMSPMGMLWTFLGASLPYQRFVGAAEVVPAVLLLFPATAAVGALAAIAVLANVVVLNFTYDVPVKLYSAQLLIAAVVLAWPEFRRLFDVLVRNVATHPRSVTTLFAGPRAAWGRIIGAVAVALCVAFTLWQVRSEFAEQPAQQSSPLFGAWDVAYLARAGRVAPHDDPTRWRRLAFTSYGFGSVRLESDSSFRVRLTIDSLAPMVRLERFGTQPVRDLSSMVVAGWRLRGDSLFLNGTEGRDSLHVVAIRKSVSEMRLVSRGFHWIQEYPYNR